MVTQCMGLPLVQMAWRDEVCCGVGEEWLFHVINTPHTIIMQPPFSGQNHNSLKLMHVFTQAFPHMYTPIQHASSIRPNMHPDEV